MPLRLLTKKKRSETAPDKSGAQARKRRRRHQEPVYQAAPAIVLEKDDLLRHLQLDRFGAILRDAARWQTHASVEMALQRAGQAIDDRFALVPEGFITMPATIRDAPGYPETDVQTEPFLLSRHAVSNAAYQHFVDDGGYQSLELWPQEVWPHLIDFTDLTEKHAPRFWRDARHDVTLAEHPVVGICFYEAAAFAQWAGYRLPTEAEWQMAASWSLRTSANVLRRFPWGDALDKSRCNIWASSVGRTSPVHAYESGSAPNGVKQLVGNVWEWTSSPFDVLDDNGKPVLGDMLMISVRGGAYDTYFPSQATAGFRTGLACLMRSHNVGFRCAMDLPE